MKSIILGIVTVMSFSAFAISEQTESCAKALTHNDLISTYEDAVVICESTNDVQRSYAQKLEYFGYVSDLGQGLAISTQYSTEEIDLAMSLVRSNNFKNIRSALKSISK